ncbi:hypothetical protein VNO77_46332 [Canavalia gladiata]|uniref:Uncharacterized protein n=1 Tax=Canavalia gladiata TaxID=3824 RepID=A0AAN9JJ29_CANGL
MQVPRERVRMNSDLTYYLNKIELLPYSNQVSNKLLSCWSSNFAPFPALVFCYTFECVKHSGMLCSRSKKDSRSAGGSAFTSDLSRFLKEFLESYGMAMVSTLVSSNLFFGSADHIGRVARIPESGRSTTVFAICRDPIPGKPIKSLRVSQRKKRDSLRA